VSGGANSSYAIEVALIGLVGVVLGLLISEFFRRRNRIEFYSQKLFDRRLEAHEKLLSLLNTASTVADEVMSNDDLTREERMDLISLAIHGIASHVDDQPMHIDPLVGAHCTAVFMGAEDVADLADPVEREAATAMLWRAIRDTKAMIRREAGADEIDRHFRAISRSQPSSPVINRIKELMKGQPTKVD
jgi:hypothetical protein